MIEAAPFPVFRSPDKATVNGVAVNVTQFLDAFGLTLHVEVVVPRLPERDAFYRSQFAGGVLLQHLDRDRELFALGFADQKVYVLAHDYVTCSVEVVPPAGAFEDF